MDETQQKQSIQKKGSFRSIGILTLVVIAFLIGTYVGHSSQSQASKIQGVINMDAPTDLSDVDFEPFWKAWNAIDEKYPSAGEISSQERVYGAISGLAASIGDPYTAFFPPSEAKDLADELSGEFSGVGMELGIKDKILTVIAPLKDTPAYRAGIKAGDKLIQIDETYAADLSIDEAIKLVRGEAGTNVSLTVIHEGETEPEEIVVTRGRIIIPTIESELRSDGIYTISIYNFSMNSDDLFADAVKKFKESGSKRLILDLRGNPGGYLEESVDIASWFLPAGVPVVIEDFGGKQEEHIYRSKGYDAFGDDLEMIVLADHGSASASEILAGALREHSVATIVGTTTYGKGSVQELVSITADSALKVTVAKWLTPKRVSISEKGIAPDVEVEYTQEDADAGRDPQLDKAVELLKH